jgi:hypothetical protein
MGKKNTKMIVNLPYIESKDASKIYYENFGDGKSYPIILIHPIGGNTDI